MPKNELTEAEAKELREYLQAAEEFQKENMPHHNALDLIGDMEGLHDVYDWQKKWEEFNKPYQTLLEKAVRIGFDKLDEASGGATSFDIMRLALPEAEGSTELSEKLKSDITPLLSQDYIALIYGDATNLLFNIPWDKFKKDDFTKTATCKWKGLKITLDHYDKFIGSDLTTSALMLYDTACAHLADVNAWKATRNIRTTVRISLLDYAERRHVSITPRIMDTPEEQEKENARAKDRKKKFIKKIKRDLDNLELFHATVQTSNEQYIKLGYITPDHAVINDYIEITFPLRTAVYLLNSHIAANFPTTALGIDARNPNTYRIARYIILHYNMDKNHLHGTAETLKVRSLLEAGQDIVSYETLKARNHTRDWPTLIKGKLETSLNSAQREGVFTSWKYRNPKTKKNVSRKEAGTISWEDYYNLDIDFTFPENPERIARTEKIKQRIEEKSEDKPKKKRGRPPKSAGSMPNK